MTPIKNLISLFIFSVLLSSCGVSKSEIVYFQNLQLQNTENTSSISSSEMPKNLSIRSNDLLSITVSALEQAAAAPFNLTILGTRTGLAASEIQFNQNQQALQNYLVDSEGNIEFPILGTVPVAGLSRQELQSVLKIKISEYVQDPIVNVRILNFQVSVLGEVKNPGTYDVGDEYLTLPQALGLAGDLTIFGERQNVLVIRQAENNTKHYKYLDLTDSNTLSSPFYMLRQNDVIYVEPKSNYLRASYTRNSQVYISILSALISLTILITR
ncbi:MAG: sugar transporter [Flavobacteriaceae bacterium]|nr:sugar transporter [Flavobacteriaceae bacterium]